MVDVVYVTRSEAAEIDRRATEERGIPVTVLMENAGRAVAEKASAMRRKSEDRVLVLCGKGNNGGDGFVCARLLALRGIPVTVALMAAPSAFDRASAAGSNLEALTTSAVPVEIPSRRRDLEDLLARHEIVVDAIFGTGLSRPSEGFGREAIDAVNASGKPVLAVDVPSGLDCDTGRPLGVAVRAAATVTMGFPKAGFRASSAREFTGEVIVADIYRS